MFSRLGLIVGIPILALCLVGFQSLGLPPIDVWTPDQDTWSPPHEASLAPYMLTALAWIGGSLVLGGFLDAGDTYRNADPFLAVIVMACKLALLTGSALLLRYAYLGLLASG